MSRRIRESDEYKRGTVVELKIQSWLAAQGRPVARVRHGGDIAPALMVWNRRVVLPDLQAHMHAGLVWIEVKAKTTCGVFEKAGIRTTGIDARSLDEYLLVEQVTGSPVFIVFVHSDQREIRWVRASAEGWLRGNGAGAAMVYRDYDALRFFAPYDAVMGTETAPSVLPDALLFAPDAEAVQLSLAAEGAA